MSAQHDTVEAKELALAAKGRMVSLVIVGTMMLWFSIQFLIGPALFGEEYKQSKYIILVDFFAMAALAWTFIVSLQIRRARKAMREQK